MTKIKSFLRSCCARSYVSLVIILLVGSFLRFYQLGTESIWFDEAASVYSGGFWIPRPGLIEVPHIWMALSAYWGKSLSKVLAGIFALLVPFAIISIKRLSGHWNLRSSLTSLWEIRWELIDTAIVSKSQLWLVPRNWLLDDNIEELALRYGEENITQHSFFRQNPLIRVTISPP